jgi:hypothetical protein
MSDESRANIVTNVVHPSFVHQIWQPATSSRPAGRIALRYLGDSSLATDRRAQNDMNEPSQRLCGPLHHVILSEDVRPSEESLRLLMRRDHPGRNDGPSRISGRCATWQRASQGDPPALREGEPA